jgi:predicted transcriptional regulator
MNASTTMTIRVPVELKEKLGRLALGTRRSRSYLATEAVTAYVDRELSIIEGIQHGLADVKAGRVSPHSEVMAQAREIVADARRNRAAGNP